MQDLTIVVCLLLKSLSSVLLHVITTHFVIFRNSLFKLVIILN